MSTTEILGYIAATCTTVAFLPQVLLIYKTRNTESISLLMFVIFTFGLALWGVYGILIHSVPVMVANGITILLAGYILIMKIRSLRSQKHE
ncbi:MAG: SemiSWEET transporter [Cytophagaceae bacterium]|jgi:MtN3 and saliva related transmembrane protein|nr:SemiSWEET transporter [Cytophagaceae bacterium]